MTEETIPTTFDLTCNDGTVFTLPSNHPEITAGSIGGVAYHAIVADPALMPAAFEQYCTHRPPPVEKGESEPLGNCPHCGIKIYSVPEPEDEP